MIRVLAHLDRESEAGRNVPGNNSRYMKENSGTHFDPHLIEKFLSVIERKSSGK
jgi:hypothetical protein